VDAQEARRSTGPSGYDPAVQDMPFAERTVPGVLARTVARCPDRPFITFGSQTSTFGEFDRDVNRYARFLESLELGRGRLAIMLPNCLEFVLAWFAASKLAAVYVPINTEYLGEVLRHQLGKAEVTHLLVDVRFADRVAQVADALPLLRTVILLGTPDDDDPAAIARLPARLRVAQSDDFRGFAGEAVQAGVRHADPHSILFTSGTTGLSKGVASSHCHVVSYALDFIEINHYGEGDATFSPMPLFHVLGSWLAVLPAVICGTHVAVAPRFSASGYWDAVRRHGATVTLGIFSLVPLLLQQPARADDADHRARAFYIGQHDAGFERRFGLRIVNAYGATETGAVTFTPFGERAPEGSCGRAHADKYEVRIVDEFDREVGPGEVGEIVLRARDPYTLMDGYDNDAPATVAVFRNQWFHTGDNARRDEAGWFYFIDRKKDAIRVRGENVSSFEIEATVALHPAVLECAAVAVPSPLGEDEVKLFVVRRPGSELDHEALWDFCATRMPGFWLPRVIEFLDAMPHTPTHKVMKYRLREDREGGDARSFDVRTRLAATRAGA
jgi:crotonobetaine/carnitine-CoA ligase